MSRFIGLIQVDYLEKDKLIHNILDSVRTTEEAVEERINNIIVLIILSGILTLLFFVRNLGSFLILLFSALVISIFILIKNKERRRK